ncbi:MAG TPA: hypothetical protein VF506_21380 [Streptosporangiaceae bacterium]
MPCDAQGRRGPLAERLIRDVATYADQAELHVIPPLCPLAVSSADFSHAPELIERAT